MSCFSVSPAYWTNWFFYLDNDKEKTALVPLIEQYNKYYDSFGLQENKQEIINGEKVCKITIPLPGFPKENISVKICNSQLMVSAEYKNRKINETFSNKNNIYNLAKTNASYLNGLLTIIIPVSKEEDEWKEVLIE